MRRTARIAIILIPTLCLCALLVYQLPPVHDRLAWRLDELYLRIKYTINPPQEVVFIPQERTSATPQATARLTQTPLPESAIPTDIPTASEPDQATAPPTQTPSAPSATPSPSPTALPDRIELTGVRYDDQHGRLNYCAPASLSMALSFWGWQGNRDVVGPVLKPDEKDKNVMPYEMVYYVTNDTDLRAVERVGGDLDTIKRFLAAGYPVLVEKGTYLRDLTGVVSWMGHYQVITGFDDSQGQFNTQDSYIKPDHKVAYEDMLKHWRAFNYTYIIIYPPENEAEVMDILGPDADELTNFENAAIKAANEVFGLSGIDQYFAWFNRGSSLVKLQDYAGASNAYDEAFAVYPSIPEADRPWRMLWYQTGPYFAYYYYQRYWDLLYLADSTLNTMQGDRNLEESYYWRGMAKVQLGDTAGAIEDFRASLQYHPGFEPPLYQLSLLGAPP